MPATANKQPRINARLDERHSAKLDFLKRTTGLPVSDIVKRGIDLMYQDVRTAKGAAFERLTASGFIASGEGAGDLSERTKEELADLLTRKHADR